MNIDIKEVCENYIIYEKLEQIKKHSTNNELIFLCVGNSKIWYDSFGPMVGSVLKALNFKHYIYGNNKFNINSDNLNDYVNLIYTFHNNPCIIVIDSCISNTNQPHIKIEKGSIICASLSKNSMDIGNFNIKFCINKEILLKNEIYNVMIKEIKKICRFINFVF